MKIGRCVDGLTHGWEHNKQIVYNYSIMYMIYNSVTIEIKYIWLFNPIF